MQFFSNIPSDLVSKNISMLNKEFVKIREYNIVIIIMIMNTDRAYQKFYWDNSFLSHFILKIHLYMRQTKDNVLSRKEPQVN